MAEAPGPRIPPLPESEWTDEMRALLTPTLANGRSQTQSNFLTTMVRHPAAYRRWASYSVRLMWKGVLPGRHRELAILRVGWLCQGPFEWGQHVIAAHREGLTSEEIERVIRGPDDPEWDPFEAAVVRAVDELRSDGAIADDTWATLATQWNDQELIELLMVIGNYHTVAWVQNSLRVDLDPGAGGLEAR